MKNAKKSRTSLQRRAFIAGTVAASAQILSPVSVHAGAKRPASMKGGMMDIDRFVEDCVAANAESDSQAAVNEVLARAVSAPGAVVAALGEPDRAGLNVLLKSPTLTIFAATWTPQMNLMPHDHLMWANIGIYTGREDNIYWKRTC